MADYHDRKRLDAAARAQRKREDEAAALANQLKAQAARAELERQNAAAKREQDREDFLAASQIKEQRRAQRTQRLRARLSGVRRWLAEHVVDLLIYPLALASAVLAIPAMARSGVAIYGSSSGVVLPVLSELGMWAFAIAVQVRRRKNPDVSVWALQVGIVVFAAYGVVLNFLDGARHGLDAGLVMALASVAGVIAHQLVTASARRTRAERAAARLARQTADRIGRAQRSAVRGAVAQIEPDGTAVLVYRPGRFTLTRFRHRLIPATVPGLPVEPVPPVADALADEVEAFLATQPDPARPGHDPTGGRGRGRGEDGDEPGGNRVPADPGPAPVPGGGAATPDTGADQQEPTPAKKRTSRASKPRAPRRQQRSEADLRREFAAAIADGTADPGTGGPIDPNSAQSIARTLRCGDHKARALRREYQNSKED